MRLWLFGLLGLVLNAGFSAPGRAATNLTTMQFPEIQALQKRLAGEGCYAGPIDGQASAATAQAVEACPDQSPVLRIETGMHVANINRVAVDDACSLAVTGSDDKTLRLWRLPEGRLVRTLRVPIGPENGGKIFAVAESPDGRFVAAGGWDAAFDRGKGVAIYVFDTSSGALVVRVGAYPLGVDSLRFSPDGRWLAIGLGNGHGLRVIDTATWAEVASDPAYRGGIPNVGFAKDGSLYSVSLEGMLTRYGAGPAFKKERQVHVRRGLTPNSSAIDPRGQLLAVGYLDSPQVDIFDAHSLKFAFSVDISKVVAKNLSRVAWQADGSRLVAAGLFKDTDTDPVPMQSFDRAGRYTGATPLLAQSTIYDIQPCGGGFVITSDDPGTGLVDAAGVSTFWKTATAPNMRNKDGDALMISGDAERVRFGLESGSARPVMFDLKTGILADAPTPAADLAAALTQGLPVSNWLSNTSPTFEGRPLPLFERERAEGLAIRRDLTGFVLGGERALRSFDGSGRGRWARFGPGRTQGVDLSSDGQIAVVAYTDGTIRWQRWADGQELLALFVNRNTRAWVAWTPSGYYMASPGGEDMIGWHVNRGWAQEADFFPASRFRDKFNRPDVVRAVLQTLDEDEAINAANAAAKRRGDETPIIERLPPVITILSPRDGAVAAPGMVEIRYRTRMPSGGTLDRVEAFVDGAKIEARGLGPASPGPDGSTSVTLPMPDHDAEISLVAYADGKASDAARVQLKGTMTASSGVPAAEDDALKPSLYALLIGVTHYENKAYDLAYPAQDAIGLAEALKSQEGKLYRHVEVKVLTDKDATAIAVKKGLLWLQKQTTARDLAIVFAAGHGLTDPRGKFWFLTTDADPDALSISAVSKDDIANVLYDLPGKKLLFLDACHSGAALSEGTRGIEQTDLSAAINDFAQTEGGVVAYAASTGREYSFENEQWGHGAFTKALIEGFEGKADILHKGRVTTASLDLFIETRVKELTDGRQHPVMTRPTTVPDFPIAAVQ